MLLQAPHTHAQTSVTGSVTADTTWSASKSPYIIAVPIEISPTATLTVEEGVEIRIVPYTSVTVKGTIRANGTAQNPIRITMTEAFAAGWMDPGSCSGIVVSANAIATFSHTVFAGLWDGICFHDATATITDSVFSDGAGILGRGSTLTLSRVRFANLFTYAAIFAREYTTVTADFVEIQNADGAGIVAGEDSTVSIRESTISTRNGSGVIVEQNGSLDAHTISVETEYADAVRAEGKVNVTIDASRFKAVNGIALSFNSFPIVLVSFVHRPAVANAYVDPSTDPSHLVLRHSELYGSKFGFYLEGDRSIVGTVADNSIHDTMYGSYANLPTPFVAENNWWGDASGPRHGTNPSGIGDAIAGDIRYAPWLTVDPLAPSVACCSSVVFLPGLEASRLYMTENAAERQLWEPNSNADVSKLFLNESGTSMVPNIYTKDIIGTSNSVPIFRVKIYESFISEMNTLVADGSIASWKALPYDWRFAVDTIVSGGVAYRENISSMAEEVAALAAASKTKKVTIIGHSNGGLVAKALMKELQDTGKASLVDRVIFVATPQLGTPLAVAAMLHGHNESLGFGLIMTKSTARSLAEHAPGVYGLLPSARYFESVSDPVVTFDPSVDAVTNFRSVYGEAISTKAALDGFLRGDDGRQKPASSDTVHPTVLADALLGGSADLHQTLDDWIAPLGVDVIEIAGWGIDTIKGIAYKASYPCTKLLTTGICAPKLDYEPLFTEEGDKTVVYPSALSMDETKYYVNLLSFNKEKNSNSSHKNILENQAVKDLIKKILYGSNEIPAYISESKPVPSAQEKKIKVSMHSPADIHLYDGAGNHTGPLESAGEVSYYEEAIPNSYYVEFGEGKYAGFDSASQSVVRIQGTGAGTFTVRLDTYVADAHTASTVFTDIPVTPSLRGEITAAGTATPLLALDVDGNGTTDMTVTPATETDPMVFLQIMQKTIPTLGLPRQIERWLVKKIDIAIKLAAKDPSKRQQIIAFIKKFSREADLKKWGKIKKITPEQHSALIEMIMKLLNSIK